MVRAAAFRMRLRAWLMLLERRFAFDSRANVIAATVTVALLCGLVSLLLGQDANWDLRNYHLYNGYAALEGRLIHDLAPAQMQTYFSPVLDIVHYWMMVRWPAPLAGFVFGVWHGLIFLPVAGIAWLVLHEQAGRARWAPLLGLAGLCTAAFLSQLGTSMGDSSTALFVLGAVFLAVFASAREAAGQVTLRYWVLSGVLLGVAVALKLTNAVYAVAMAVMVLAVGSSAPRRLLRLIILAVTALVVAAVLVGWWYMQVWQAFGNPLFPQFNSLFNAPLAAPVSVADTRWLPQGIWQHMTWPLRFTFSPREVSEVSLVQCYWALLYLAALWGVLRTLRRQSSHATFARPLTAVVVFFVTAYLLWQGLFSIHRYLVVLEVLAPLLLWVACIKWLPVHCSQRWAGRVVGVCAAVSLLGWAGWGHERWAGNGFTVELPAMELPASSVVYLVGSEPQAWRVPFLPEEARYVAVASNFPESAAYKAKVMRLFEQRQQRFAMIPGPSGKLAARFARINGWADQLQLSGEPGCTKLKWVASKARRLRAHVLVDEAGRCRMLPRQAGTLDPVGQVMQLQGEAAAQLAAYRMRLVDGSCQQLSSSIGKGAYPYQWCRVELLP